jgi:hypothetical protein
MTGEFYICDWCKKREEAKYRPTYSKIHISYCEVEGSFEKESRHDIYHMCLNCGPKIWKHMAVAPKSKDGET